MPFRLGMLGAWHTHADGLVRQIAAHPDEFSLIGCYDSDAATASERMRAWSALVPELRRYDTADALLSQQLDGIVVEGRVYENLQFARMALEQGKPVLLEKPAGDNFDEFRRIVDLAERKHLHVQMIYLFRYMSAVQELLRRSRGGMLGDIYEFRARLPKDLDSYDRYVADLGRYAGGIFFEMAGHVIDVMIAVLGRPASISPFMAHHSGRPEKFIDNGVAIFGFDKSWAIVEVPALEVAPHARRVEVYGTRGAFVIPHLGSGHLPNRNVQPVEVFKAGEADWKQIELEAATLQISDLREFAAVATGKKSPDFSMAHDINVQEALLKASGML